MVAIGPAHAGASNSSPEVSIEVPRPNIFSSETIKLKAKANDPDGFVAEVQFFAGTNLIGIATNPPFNILWRPLVLPCEYHTINVKAIAVDNLGAKTESSRVPVQQACGRGPITVLDIVSPKDGMLLGAPAAFVFSAELLANDGGVGLEFFVGTNSVGRVSASMYPISPSVSVTVSNLPVGNYTLSVIDRYNVTWSMAPVNVRVVNLGVQSPHLTLNGRLQFDIVTSYPGRQTVIQTSENLLDWVPISTNQPSSNTFTFTESSHATNSHRFYRVFLPPE
jgi:hypothetical protein